MTVSLAQHLPKNRSELGATALSIKIACQMTDEKYRAIHRTITGTACSVRNYALTSEYSLPHSDLALA